MRDRVEDAAYQCHRIEAAQSTFDLTADLPARLEDERVRIIRRTCQVFDPVERDTRDISRARAVDGPGGIGTWAKERVAAATATESTGQRAAVVKHKLVVAVAAEEILDTGKTGVVHAPGIRRRDVPAVVLVAAGDLIVIQTNGLGFAQTRGQRKQQNIAFASGEEILEFREGRAIERFRSKPRDVPDTGRITAYQGVISQSARNAAFETAAEPKHERIVRGIACQILEAPETYAADVAGVAVRNVPRGALIRPDERVTAVASDIGLDAGNPAGARGRRGAQIDRHVLLIRVGIEDHIVSSPSVDDAAEAATGKGEEVSVSAAHQVLDADEALPVQAPGVGP